MKKFLLAILLTPLLGFLPAKAVECSFSFLSPDSGLATNDNLVEKSPIAINEDIQISFTGVDGITTYDPTLKSTYVNMPLNSGIKINGLSDDVKITKVTFTVTKKSYRFDEKLTTCTPAGELTFDEEAVASVWTYDEGTNSVTFDMGYSARFTDVTVEYTGGKLGGNNDEPQQPGNATPVECSFSFLSPDSGLATNDNLVEKSPIAINEDIQISFTGVEGMTTYDPTLKSTYVNMPLNSGIKINGLSDDVKITKVTFTVTKKSYRFDEKLTTCTPAGELTFDEETVASVWTYDEGTNSVTFDMGYSARFTDVTVEYTGGKLGSGNADPQPSTPKEYTFVLADEQYGLVGGENLFEHGDINLNEDLRLNFAAGMEGQPANATYNNNGYAQVPINSVITIAGASDDVMISKIIFKITANSYRFYPNNTKINPEGTFTWDADAKENIWEYEEGANVVTFGCDGTVRFTALTIVYTGGTATGGNTPDPDEPDPDTPETPSDDNLLSTGFDTTAEFAQFTIINVEAGSNTWKHSNGNPYAKIENDLGNTIPKDDYLVSPGLPLKAGLTYRLTFDTWCGIPEYPEIVAAYLLTAADNVADKTTIIEPTEVTNDNVVKRQLDGTFSVAADGTYYVAIHAASKPGMHYLYVDNVEISRGVAAMGPGEVTDLSVEPSPMGEQEVALNFAAPTLCFDGATPLADLKSVVIKRDGVQIADLQATTGQPLTFTDRPETTGWHTYAVTAAAASGKSFDSKATVYVGVARPMAPASLTAEETTPGTVELTWEPVTTNIYGHAVDASLITYNVYDGQYNPVLKADITDTKITIDYLSADDAQKIVTFYVKAKTSAGESNQAATTPAMTVGTPHTMPYAETFAGSHITSGQPAEFIEDEHYPNALWRCFEALDAFDINPITFDRGLMAFMPNWGGTSSTFRTGKIHIDADASNPYLSMFYYVLPGSASRLTVKINDDEATELTLNGDERGWKELLVNLAEYKGTDIRLALTAFCANTDYPVVVDNIAIKNEANNDMAIVRARIPYEMNIGADHTCSVKVTNLGVNTAAAYTLNVLADGVKVQSFEGAALERGKVAEHTFSLTPDVKPGETLNYTVSLEFASDENTADNVAEIEVAVPDHNLPAPYGLDLNGTTLTWSAFTDDDFTSRTITETFEAYDEFKINSAGEWSFVDGDAYPTFGMEDGYHAYPGMYEPMAFMVFNNHDSFFSEIGTMNFDAHQGGQCMVSMAINCANLDKITNNDWLISPELSGEAQTVKFFARSTSMVFRETFSVLYSTYSDPLAVNNYTELAKYEEIMPDWTEYTAELPAGTKFFAIRNVSDNQYMLFVDDVTFEAAGKPVEVAGYDVYLAAADTDDAEWTKANDALLAEPTLALTNVADNNKYARVHAVFANGIETVSDAFDISTLGVGNVLYDAGEASDADYYDINGRRLGAKPTQPGIYVVRDAAGARKVLVK